MSLQQFATQFTPPLQRLICEYMGRGFTSIVCPEYFGSLYGDYWEPQRASEMIGLEGDMLSYSTILHYVDVEYVARGAAASDNTGFIWYPVVGSGLSIYKGLMWGYASAKNYDGFRSLYKTMLESLGNLHLGLWTYSAVSSALAGALIHFETDSGAFADKILAETKFLDICIPVQVIRVMCGDVKKYSPLAIDWLMAKLPEHEKRDIRMSRALDDLRDAMMS